LGLTITEFHENRVSVDMTTPGVGTVNPNATPQPVAGAAR
jgi:type IV secretion system protein VirB5